MDLEKINIALITDRNYFTPALVTIESLLNNTKELIEIRCVLTEEVETDIHQIENNFKNKYPNGIVKFIYFDDSVLSNIQTKFHISKAAYVKIYLPEILMDWSKCIFLDSDLLIRKDILELWSYAVNMSDDEELGAVWNPGYIQDNEFIGIENDGKTLNSGLLVMNLEAMRKNKSSDKLKEFIKAFNAKTHLNDQPAFNAIYKEKWIEIPLEWNAQFLFFIKSHKKIGIHKEELRKIKSDPAIVHFTTSSKPWKYRSVHPYKKEYMKYLNQIDKDFYDGKVTFIDTLKIFREFGLMTIYKFFN